MGTNMMCVDRMGHYMRLHAHIPMCSQRRIFREPVTWNSTCTEICQRNTVSFTQYVHVHRSVRVTVRSCLHILSLQVVLFASGTKAEWR